MFDRHAKPGQARQKQLERYAQLVQRFSPKSAMAKGLWRAFWVGGCICCIGQALLELGRGALQMSNLAAGSFASATLVLLTAILTAAGVFDRIGRYAGAGAFVPITGFANAMVSSAMEFAREGLVLGLGAKLFTLAGPVLVWGTTAAALLGVAYAIFPW